MKITIACAALLLGSVAVSDLLAQGQFSWGNNLPAVPAAGLPQVRAPIYGVDSANPTLAQHGNTAQGLPAGNTVYGGALLQGTGFTMAIYLGLDAAAVLANNRELDDPLGRTAFRTGTAAGFMSTLTALAQTGLPGGTANVNYQFRAWDNQNGAITSWSQVMAAGGTIPAGMSEVSVFPAALASPPNPPPGTYGIRSFNLTVVPEPSLIALGALGLGALLLRRRK